MDKREYHVVKNFELVQVFDSREEADNFISEYRYDTGCELDLMVCDIREEK